MHMCLVTIIYLITKLNSKLKEDLDNNMSLYLSRIEGPPPKRNAGGSTPPKDELKNTTDFGSVFNCF